MTNIDYTKYKQIVVSKENYEWLKTLGQAADSFNDVVNRLRQANVKNLEGPKGSTPTAQPAPTPTPSTTHTGTTLEVDRSLRHMATTEGSRRMLGGIVDVSEK